MAWAETFATRRPSRWAVQEATTLAYHDMFLLMAAMLLLTAVPVLRLR